MRTNMKKFLALVLALSMMFSLSVTTRADEESEDLGLIITPLSLELQVGDEPTPVQVTIFSGDPTDVTFRWNSEDETIVRITGNGTSARVTPMQAGSTTIEVFAEKGSVILGHDTIPVTVKSAVEPIRVQAVGKTSLNMSIGETATLGAKVSGGSGEYTYAWNSNGSVEIESYDDTQATIYAATGGTGRVGLTVMDAQNKGNYATAYWDVTVADSAAPVKVSLNKYGMSLRVGGTDTLQVSASGGSGEFTYRWHTDARIVDVTTNGASAVVTGVKPGTDTIGVDVIDSKTGEAQLLECVVEVLGSSANFDVAEKATVGGGLAMNTIAKAIANAYRSQFGTTLNYGASVQMTTPSGKIGSICMQDGTPVYSNLSISYVTFEDCYFTAVTAGKFSTKYTVQDGGNSISGTITINTSGGAGVSSVTINTTRLEMETYSSYYLSLGVLPINAVYTVKWTSDNNKIATVYGDGASVTVATEGRTGTANIKATVTDVNGKTFTKTCKITVGSSATYNPTLAVTLDSDYYGTDTSESMARQFRNIYGYNLADNATIRFGSQGNTRYGVMHLANGSAIRANTNYTFREWVNMWFEPLAAGTFSLPYTLTYNGDTLSGTLDIYIRSASVSAELSHSKLTLAPYSNQAVYVSVKPANSYFTVRWTSSNSNVVAVYDNGTNAIISSSGKTGSAAVVATITDRNGVQIYRTCNVTVTNKAATEFNPSVSTTIGVPYTGTGTYDAITAQFRNLYGVALPNSAKIRFASTGNNSVAVLRLRNGTAIRALTDYTMGDLANMYLDPYAIGTFSLPYSVVYNGNELSGISQCNITGASVVATIALNNTNPYSFASSANGYIGSAVLGNAITNAVGTKWSYIRFAAYTSSVGTLYRDASRAALGTNNIRQNELGNLYFIPAGVFGEYSIPFVAYGVNGNALANGLLQIRVGSSVQINFADVKADDWFAVPVQWAISRNITNGMGKNAKGQDTFGPNITCNNAHIITFLWRSQGSPLPTIANPFNDVKASDYYYNAAVWAYEKGLIDSRTFGGEKDCTRAMAVTYMWKLAGRPGAAASVFSDVARGTDQALAIDWALSKNITTGIGNDANGRALFGPDMTCTRGHIVTFLCRAYA